MCLGGKPGRPGEGSPVPTSPTTTTPTQPVTPPRPQNPDYADNPKNPNDPRVELPIGQPDTGVPDRREPDGEAPLPVPGFDPAPVPTGSSPEEIAAQKLKRLRALRAGLLSTIKTSPGGTTTPPLVSTPGLYGSGVKGKLGQ